MTAFLDAFPRHAKMHPCSVVLSRDPIISLTPILCALLRNSLSCALHSALFCMKKAVVFGKPARFSNCAGRRGRSTLLLEN